ncbi:putative GIY-YIG superfamily endonuclease [Prosthecobacter vanneervenii]|uniref:Putative GIY-YIG superfamily endonuclease n=1 Tax=Prosthecobacter vanneervenii TaxID=48466 RepID=A0A7W8DMA0_9BACT|nr:putative GIY-YIG superfamily endonuclease [Prosthecobacter vanneervenii]
MPEEPTILWTGESGAKFKYWIHPIETNFTKSAGNYIFAKESSPGKWRPIYIGQTNDLSRRLGEHANDNTCIDRNGATHIHAHTQADEEARLAEEKDLIRKWNPPCNTQHAD